MKKILFAFILSLFVVGNAYAQFAAVQTATQVVASTTTVSVTLSPTKVNNLVVAYAGTDNTQTCDSVSDDKGNTYSTVITVLNGVNRVCAAYGVQTVGGATTISFNFTGVAAKRVGADEYSGGETSNATIFDTYTTGTGSSTSLSVSTLTTSGSGNLIFAVCRASGSVTHTAGSGYTSFGGVNPTSTKTQYKLSSGATETAPETISMTGAWTEIALSFKPMVIPAPVRKIIISQ